MSENERDSVDLHLLEKVIFETIHLAEKISFNKEELRQQIIVGLCLSILERSHSIVLLIREEKTFDAKIILRSLLEHFVDLHNLAEDENYHLHFQLPFLKGLNQTLREAQRGNPFFSRIAREIPIADELESNSAFVREVKDLGAKDLKVWEKFKHAGLNAEYESLYRSLSKQVHPTYAGIIERHFCIDAESGDFSVHGFQQPTDSSNDTVIETTHELVCNTGKIVASLHA